MLGDIGPLPSIPESPEPEPAEPDISSKLERERPPSSDSSPRELLLSIRGWEERGDKSGGSSGNEGLFSGPCGSVCICRLGIVSRASSLSQSPSRRASQAPVRSISYRFFSGCHSW